MTLADLKKLVDSVNTLGFKPEEIEVAFKYTFSDMYIVSTKTSVEAGENIKPTVRIELAC